MVWICKSCGHENNRPGNMYNVRCDECNRYWEGNATWVQGAVASDGSEMIPIATGKPLEHPKPDLWKMTKEAIGALIDRTNFT